MLTAGKMSLDIEKNAYRPNSIISAAIAMMVTGRLRASATIHIIYQRGFSRCQFGKGSMLSWSTPIIAFATRSALTERLGASGKPALESVRAAQKDVAVARAQRRGGLPEDDVDLIVPYLVSDLQLREVAPHGEPAGPHIAGVRRGGKLINWERFDRVALHVVSVDIDPAQRARRAEARHAPYHGLW